MISGRIVMEQFKNDEFRKAEMALYESENRFRKIVEQAPIAMAMVSMDNVIEFINQKAVKVFGYLHEDIPTMERWWTQAYPEEKYRREVVADWTGRIQRALKEGTEIAGNEYRTTCKDGSQKTMFISGAVVADKIFVMFDDITERKRTEEALRLRESYLSAIIENQPGLLWMKDRNGKFLAVNTKFSNSSGQQDAESLIGKTDFDIWPQELAAQYVADDNRVIKSGKPYIVEEPISDEGSIRWFETFKAPIFDKQGIIIGTTGFSRDITERKLAEEALRESEERFSKAFKTSPYAYMIANMEDGRIVEVNDAFIAISGYTREEALASSTLNLNIWVNAEDRKRMVTTLRDSGIVERMETRLRAKNGNIVTALLFARIIRLGNRSCILSIMEDITERKKTESLLLNAQKLDSLGVLAGGIAHDFNNLLTGIFGYVDLARSVSKDAKAIEYLESTIASMNRARSLTLQLLTFAKGGSPVQKVTPSVPFIQETAQFALSGSNISCEFSLAEGLWPCNIDKNQVSQVIDNIVINAQQAMPNGGTIKISAQNISLKEKHHPSLTKGNYVKVSIKDSGIGIPKDIMPRIFDPFYTTKSKGHGLGLATCYSIVTRHGGCIDVESEPGKGSTFHVYLPASTESVVENTAAIARHKGSGTILVVDDEEVIRNMVRQILESMGYTVVCKKDGKAAVDFFIEETKAGHKFAAMIFDLTIPGGMGGIEAVEAIRKLNAGAPQQVPVFVASGYADNSVMRNPVEHGFAASISKPFSIAELSAMLNKHLMK
jgi:two-component system, cell cycle sensor histidine kinase and response regulator CckA